MSADASQNARRVTLDLRRPRLHLLVGVRPTVVIDGRGQPAQWGLGTWLVPSDLPVEVGVFLFNRAWRSGEASAVLSPEHTTLTYWAPFAPIGRGALEAS
ncbi:hypothetical protein [Microbacterium sp. cf332]|uniref:hypothetical protein n=1 Tax=Microbacterium sp. cf332 TaxID=1761804 RepID=UPI000880044A|nr:hypothetical protein [Microbacterium sp. cf332]SDQ07956.1 hypothetical protein SAMN04487847_0230 [Microbacterium sp. cf332]